MKLVVVSPHTGDAAFSLGLAVDAWLAQGHAVEVLNAFTRSEHAPFSDVGSLHPNDRISFATAVRRREDEAWVKLCVGQPGRGRLTLTGLNLKDAPLRLHCAPEEVYSRAPELTEKVTHTFKRALEHARGDALLLPLGVRRHVDHLTAQAACLPTDAAAFPLAFYEDLPDAAQSAQALDNTVQAATLAACVPLQVAFAEERGDTEAAATRKRRLALCYDSQIDDATADLIATFSRQYQGRERLWANAAWRAAFPQQGVD